MLPGASLVSIFNNLLGLKIEISHFFNLYFLMSNDSVFNSVEQILYKSIDKQNILKIPFLPFLNSNNH